MLSLIVFTIMNSSLIPGSPSASGCYKNYSYDPFVNYSFLDAFNHKITTAVMWWMLLDILFHILMIVRLIKNLITFGILCIAL